MNKELLYRFFTGETSEKEEKVVLDWMDSSEENRKAYLKERALFDALLLHVDERKSTNRRPSLIPVWGRKMLRYAAIIIVAFSLGHFQSKKRGLRVKLSQTRQPLFKCTFM